MSAGAPSGQEWRVIKEKVEVLFGNRGDARKAAMRAGDAIDLREFIAQLRKGTADVQKDLADAVAQLEQLETNLGELGESLDETKGELATTQEGLAAAQQQLGGLQSTLMSVQQAIEAAQQAITALDQSGAAVAQELDALQAAAGAVNVPALISAQVDAPPTAAEFNLLWADVFAMRSALIDLRTAVST